MILKMKIQPIDSCSEENPFRTKDLVKPVVKSRFKRLIERQLPCVLGISSPERSSELVVEEVPLNNNGGNGEFEPSSICLANMVQNFIEETNEKHSVISVSKCGRYRCNCFNRSSSTDSSDDEFHFSGCSSESNVAFSGESSEILKSLVPCPSVEERNLLADTAKIIEINNKSCKRKSDCRKFVSDGLLALGYDVAICKSRWEKCSSYPAGEYEYVDVIVDSKRIIIDVDFRSEFEIARSTGKYKSILQSLPSIFVGKEDRLQQIISIVSEAAKQSLKKKGLHFPPWRKSEYMIAKWISPYTRSRTKSTTDSTIGIEPESCLTDSDSFSGDFDLLFSEKIKTNDSTGGGSSFNGGELISTLNIVPMKLKSSSSSLGGLASVLQDKP